MYIAMNRFKVIKERAADFEAMWRNRDSYLHEVEGFKSFHLLKGPELGDHIVYSSHTMWESLAHFEGWTKSDAFKKAHAGAGKTADPVTIGPARFEGFEAVLSS
ncbi:MAG: antibiotic biosynthesis monooxygenase family protein [Thiotrichales bacterium]